MPQCTDVLARLTTLSLLSVPPVMGLPLGAQSAQAMSPPNGTMMAPAHSNMVIDNYPHTAVVGRAALARTTDAVNPGISLTPSEGRVGSRAAVSGQPRARMLQLLLEGPVSGWYSVRRSWSVVRREVAGHVGRTHDPVAPAGLGLIH